MRRIFRLKCLNMKAVVYSAMDFEKDLLLKFNQRKHEFKFVSAQLCLGTAEYAAGYNSVIVFTSDDVSAVVIDRLAELGVKLIITRSVGVDHIDMRVAELQGITVRNVPGYTPRAVAEHAVALALALARRLIPTYNDCRIFNFRIDQHMGFNLYKKTVGIVGLGNIGQAAASIFNGFGCNVLGYDLIDRMLPAVKQVPFETLLEQSDIISIHVPLDARTHYMIDQEAIAKMKRGVMLINTSRGAVVKTADVLEALIHGKVGYFGADVYEFEKGLFFEDHQYNSLMDTLLVQLIENPNVIITPHQGFLTTEAVTEIAEALILLLDSQEKEKLVEHSVRGA